MPVRLQRVSNFVVRVVSLWDWEERMKRTESRRDSREAMRLECSVISGSCSGDGDETVGVGGAGRVVCVVCMSL